MIATFLLSATAGRLPGPEQERIGVYVLAGIFGLLVTGFIACLKEARSRRLRG